MRILLVEDEPDAARMLAKGLREQAYAVDVVADGETACYQAASPTTTRSCSTCCCRCRTASTVCRELRRAGARARS